MGAYDGQLLATRHADGRVTIDRADPRVSISAEFFHEHCPDSAGAQLPMEVGGIVRLHAANRTVIYRIDAVTAAGDYLVSWPD